MYCRTEVGGNGLSACDPWTNPCPDREDKCEPVGGIWQCVGTTIPSSDSKKGKKGKKGSVKSPKGPKSQKGSKGPKGKGKGAALKAGQSQAVELDVGAGVALVGMVGLVALVATKLRASVAVEEEGALLATVPSLAVAAEASPTMV